ncbi:MAG TPA: DUF1330 domain-containing protein [Stellaceae bacterium]|nr:DUF1330 domain-containing protein [Stellaceae bacterium]
MKQAALLLFGLVAGIAIGAGAVPGLRAQPATGGGAYVVAEMHVTDPAGFIDYERHEAATLAAYRGRVLTRALPDVREGAPANGVVAILGFASAQDANRWYNSPDYARLIPLRQKSAASRVYILQGIH